MIIWFRSFSKVFPLPIAFYNFETCCLFTSIVYCLLYKLHSHRRGHLEVFELIKKRKLYPALVGNLITLMKLGDKVCWIVFDICVHM